MREASFILPVNFEGRSTTTVTPENDPGHAYVRQALLDAFGGYTVAQCVGAWKDDQGVVHDDDSFRYTVAIRERQFIELRNIALEAARMERQLALYIVDTKGEAYIVDVGKPAELAVGQTWKTRSGYTANVVAVSSLSLGMFEVRVPFHSGSLMSDYVVEADGKFSRVDTSSPHPLDLVRRTDA